MDVRNLIKSRNRCLQRLVDLSDEFVKSTASGGYPVVDWELPQYETQRDSLLKALGLFDRKISEAVSQMQPSERTPELLESLRRELELSGALIQSVLTADEGVLSRIEQAKADVLREMAVNGRSRSLVSKFKSEWADHSSEGRGEGLDETV
jgi:hypothetical protein